MKRREFLIGSAAAACAAVVPGAVAIAAAGPITIPVTDVVQHAITDAEYAAGVEIRFTVRRLDNGELFSWNVRRNLPRFEVVPSHHYTSHKDGTFELVRQEITVYNTKLLGS